MQKRVLGLLALFVVVLVLGGCNRFLRKDRPVVEAEAQQERWCYRSLGKIDCYAEPQPGLYDRLVNVDPPSLFPSSAEAYAKRLGKTE